MRSVAWITAIILFPCHCIAAGSAADVITESGVKGGLVVHVGCTDGTRTAALLAGDAYLVHGLSTDQQRVDAARKHLLSKGLYGRVSVDLFDGTRLPYGDNMVNLLVADDPGDLPEAEIMRVLCPAGVAYLRGRKIVKPRPDEYDEWTHYLHGPGNNAVAADRAVGPPKHYQWICGPAWARSHDHLSTTSAMTSSGGRLFYIFDEGGVLSVALPPRWKLIARDAFNGVLLWKRDVGPWEGHLRGFRSGPSEIARRLVSVGDTVYATLGYGKPIAALDAATGETIRTFDQTEQALEFIVHDGVIFAVVGDRLPDNTDNAAIPAKPKKVWMHWPIHKVVPPKKHIVAVDAASGKTLWEMDNADTAGMMPTTLAACGADVYFHSGREIVSLKAASGQEHWRTVRNIALRRPSWSTPTLVVTDGVVLCGDRDPASVHPGTDKDGKPVQWVINSHGGIAPVGTITAFDAASGKKRWDAPAKEVYNAPMDVLVADGLVWSGNLVRKKEKGITRGLDLKTGAVKRERPADAKFFRVIMGHHRCYRNKATEKYLVLGRDGIEFIDVKSGKGYGHAWVRGACQYGVMPCNGLVYAPPHSCACHIETKLNSFNALAPAGGGNDRTLPDDTRLQKGPAFGTITASTDTTGWPTYRGDNARSGKATTALSPNLEKGWHCDIGGRLSTITVAGGKCFLAAADEHTVHAIDAEDGRKTWSFTAGGRVDSPPTIHDGMAIFGAADGKIYCLRAADGVLAWRFNAAITDRLIVSRGQLESVSPVHGSVLVDDGTVYAVAGRNSFLDGGMRIYGLDPKTGAIVSKKDVTAGALPDVLSSDGKSIFMRHKRYDKKLAEQKGRVAHLYSPAGFLDGDWWHRTYWLFGSYMRSGYGGWPVVAKTTPAGRIMAVDTDALYGYGRLNQYSRIGSHVGLGKMKYVLYATSRTAGKKPAAGGAQKRTRRSAGKKVTATWTQRIPILARGMVLGGTHLFIAGPPDAFGTSLDNMKHPYNLAPADGLEEQEAALAGKKGAALIAVSTADGTTAAKLELDAPPVWDGMAGANGRLYLSGTDGVVRRVSAGK